MSTLGDVLALLIAATVVIAGIVLLRWLPALVRPGRALRQHLAHLTPLLEAMLVFGALAWLVLRFTDGRNDVRLGALVLLLAVAVGAAWFAVRDLVAGVILRTEDRFEPDQSLRVGDVSGRIQRVGYRSLDVETEAGERVRVPWHRVAGSTTARTGITDGAPAHTFHVPVPRSLSRNAATARIRTAALNSFHASPRREPRVRLHHEEGDARVYEVTVFALQPEFLPEVESAVREAVVSS
jgi:small-conductance mechanosensitive channel